MRVSGNKVVHTKSGWSTALADKPLPKSGRFYFEMETTKGSTTNFVGIAKQSGISLPSHYTGQVASTIGFYFSNQYIYKDGSAYATEYVSYVIIFI